MALELVSTASDIASQVKAVNQLLEAGEPHNISVDSFSGFTGYKPQYIVDAMNEVFGWGGWGFEEISNEVAEGEKATLIVSQVRVSLKDVAFQPSGWGQARITKGDIGDARKGAQTDAIKKALSYFSIGNRAYRGLLKEDGKGNSTHKSIHTQQNGAQAAQASSNGNHANGATTATSAQPQAQSTNLSALIGSMKNRAKALGLATDAATFKALLQEATGEVLDERDLTLDRIAKINGHIAKIERMRKAS